MPLRRNQPVIIVTYNPDWKNVFEELKAVLIRKLRRHIIDIIHIGSTSIPGLAAKPIIDLNIIIENYDCQDTVSDILSEFGYLFEGEKGIKGRFAYARKSKYVPFYKDKTWMDHHLYVCSKDNDEYKRQILFRDYLKEHPHALKEYEKLKIELSIKFKNDRVAYTDSKGPFIKKIIEKARHFHLDGEENGKI